MEVKRLISRIEQYVPLTGAAPWDNSGVQIAGLREEANKIAVALDPLPEHIEGALDWGADFILTHHPLLLEPRFLNRIDDYHRVTSLILGREAWLYACHTSLDVQSRGPVGWLARELDLHNVETLDPTMRAPIIQVAVEISSLDTNCLTFLNADPQVLSVEADENGIRLRCLECAWDRLLNRLTSVLDGQPAYTVDENFEGEDTCGFGLVGDLPAGMAFKELTDKLSALTGRDFCLVYGDEPKRVHRLAYCPGSGASLAEKSYASRAQVFITGEMKYHPALELHNCVVDLGHFGLEEEMIRRFCAILAEDPELSPMECRFFPGQDPQRVMLAGGSN